jgi:7-keto-8-aminopelargonate synthetase-like enzyme
LVINAHLYCSCDIVPMIMINSDSFVFSTACYAHIALRKRKVLNYMACKQARTQWKLSLHYKQHDLSTNFARHQSSAMSSTWCARFVAEALMKTVIPLKPDGPCYQDDDGVERRPTSFGDLLSLSVPPVHERIIHCRS